MREISLVARRAGIPVAGTVLSLVEQRAGSPIDGTVLSIVEQRASDPVGGAALRLVERRVGGSLTSDTVILLVGSILRLVTCKRVRTTTSTH